MRCCRSSVIKATFCGLVVWLPGENAASLSELVMPLSAAFISVIMIWSTTPLAIKWSALGAGFSFAVLLRMWFGTAFILLGLHRWGGLRVARSSAD